MSARRKSSRVDARAAEPAPDPDVASGSTTPRRRHLEGLAHFVVYVPAAFVAALCVQLFVAAVERNLYGDDA